MDAIGVGANVIAFVVIALKAAKTTYETLSAVKDGPKIVKQVADRINQLYWILDGLKKSLTVVEDASIMGHLRICCEELNSAAEFIEGLQISSGDRHVGKIWRKLKTFLGEKDLERLNDQLTSHVTIFNLRLQGISSNMLYELRRDQPQVERMIGALDNIIQTQTLGQETRFYNLGEDICDRVNVESETIRARLNTMYEDITAQTVVSQSQSDSMLGLLKEIKGLLITTPNKQQIHVTKSGQEVSVSPLDSKPLTRGYETAGDDEELIQSIDRLCGLIHDKERTINTYTNDDDEESKSIIHDLCTILQSAYERGELIESNQTHLKPGEDRSEDFERISRRFTPTIQKHLPYEAMKQKRIYQKIRMNIGTLTLMFSHGTRLSRTIESCQDMQENSYSDYVITTTFLPYDPRRFHMLIASTFQHEVGRGIVSSISRLAVNRVLPRSSRIFKVVQKGDLLKLRRMLQNGEASLRDHDEDGGSLLFYSTKQPEMCDFLLRSGLDVDHVGGRRYYHEKVVTEYALNINLNDSLMASDPDESIRIQSCQRLLFEAGADPTLEVDKGVLSIHTYIDVFENLWSCIRSASHLEILRYNYIPMKLLHSKPMESCNEEIIRTIHDFGANVIAHDSKLRTCLHLCFVNLHYFVIGQTTFEVIKLLIGRGADPRAVDKNGNTVSDYAFHPGIHIPNVDYELYGSYSGDLWDSALQSCGLDIAKFRTEDYPRKAQYTELYSRKDFERLWQGREHLCPYWEDSPWPQPRVYSADSSDSDMDLEDLEDCESGSEGGGVLLAQSS
ncbi:ankyrin [Annulohypoxylon bovei var. microspora]|nr:ankyrin [Annulohypoxylon bovei var. microspora]